MTSYSVVIPAYNSSATLAQCIASVWAQSLPPAEVIVVDDGSTDDTAINAARLGARVIRQDNSGPGTATTRGVQAALFPWVATLDADDLWLRTKIEQQAEALHRGEADILFGHMQLFRDESGLRLFGETRPAPMRSTMLLRRDDFIAVGPMHDLPGRAGELIDWVARARQSGLRTHVLDAVLGQRRISETSLTYRLKDDQKRAYLDVVRAALARRREISA